MVKKLNLRESDDKITAKSFDELISKLKRRGYDCKDCYEGDEYLYLRKNGDPYQAEYYKKNDGTYELYLGNIHPAEEKNEGCCGKGCKSESVRTRRISRRLKEDIDDSEWEAFVLRCQENPVYKEIQKLCEMYGYKCADVIYWDSPRWLTFGLEPKDNRLPIIHYDSMGMSEWLLSVPGCSLWSDKDALKYSNGINNAKELFNNLQELPLENLERGY